MFRNIRQAWRNYKKRFTPWNTPLGRWVRGGYIYDDRRSPWTDYGIVRPKIYRRFVKPFYRDAGQNFNKVFWRPIKDASGAVGWIPDLLPSMYENTMKYGSNYIRRKKKNGRPSSSYENKIRRESFEYGKSVAGYRDRNDDDYSSVKRYSHGDYRRKWSKYKRWNSYPYTYRKGRYYH